MPEAIEVQDQELVNYTPLQRMRHSAAHVMAEAVRELFPDAKLGIGPAIEDGFYYDFDLPRALTPEDLPDIEQRMRRIIAGKYAFKRDRWPREKALEYFKAKDQSYKVELIENLPDAEVGIYKQDTFLDLCRGPHVQNTSEIGPIKLMRVAGAYWRGDEHRPMLQRIYGTAWFTQEELDQYLWRLEEALKRDHRKLGRELKLFYLSDELPGRRADVLSAWRDVAPPDGEVCARDAGEIRLPARLDVPSGQSASVQNVEALVHVSREYVPGHEGRAGNIRGRWLHPQANELPASYHALQVADAQLS